MNEKGCVRETDRQTDRQRQTETETETHTHAQRSDRDREQRERDEHLQPVFSSGHVCDSLVHSLQGQFPFSLSSKEYWCSGKEQLTST